jgi:hypothetical protein
MKLARQPHPPRGNGFRIPFQYIQDHGEWLKFIPVRD